MLWSPATCSNSTSASMDASAPLSTGAPFSPGAHDPGELVGPEAAKLAHSVRWSTANTLIQTCPVFWIFGQLDDVWAGQNET